MTQPIPKPELLNPDRVDRDTREDFALHDHRTQAELLATALAESCGYAEQLWDTLNSLRSYLLGSLPPDPRTPGPHITATSPIGPSDEQGWQNWIDAFAATTSVLCGQHGDSGFGLSRAREEARLRQNAPEPSPAAEPSDPSRPHADWPAVHTGGDRTPPAPAQPGRAAGHPSDAPTAAWTAPAKAAAGIVIGILALRGLRPQPRRTAPPSR